MELEAHFKWTFQSSIDNLNVDDNDELMFDSVSEVLNGVAQLSRSGFTSQGNSLDGHIGTMISLPSEWIENTESMVRESIFSETSLTVYAAVR